MAALVRTTRHSPRPKRPRPLSQTPKRMPRGTKLTSPVLSPNRPPDSVSAPRPQHLGRRLVDFPGFIDHDTVVALRRRRRNIAVAHVAQHEVGAGHVDSVGLGRMVLSYPELPADVLAGRTPDRRRICRTFSDCTTGPRNGLQSGCFPLDEHYKTQTFDLTRGAGLIIDAYADPRTYGLTVTLSF